MDTMEAEAPPPCELGTPYYDDGGGRVIYHGDCREIAPQLSGVTAVVSDPPYGLEFMGKEWDHGIPGRLFWEAIDAACLPGAPLLAFGGTRTFHRLVCAIEDAGFEIRDCIQWIYGSGFPKSLDVSKAIDKAAGAEREVVGTKPSDRPNRHGGRSGSLGGGVYTPALETAPATEHAKTWNGYGTALKPAHEPICVAMKPLDGTYAANAIEHGVAGINVDGCRVGTDETTKRPQGMDIRGGNWVGSDRRSSLVTGGDSGRWPANIIHDGSDEVLRLFPETGGGQYKEARDTRSGDSLKSWKNSSVGGGDAPDSYGDTGSAARFFYCPKASDREIEPAEDFPLWGETFDAVKNTHPTVKPLALMEYLIKLVTMPQRNLILDPFMGSGTTLRAAKHAGVPCIGIELEERYCEIAANRLRQEVMA